MDVITRTGLDMRKPLCIAVLRAIELAGQTCSAWVRVLVQGANSAKRASCNVGICATTAVLARWTSKARSCGVTIVIDETDSALLRR